MDGNKRRQRPEKWSRRKKITASLVVAAVVAGAFVANSWIVHQLGGPEWPGKGQVGDSFGGLNALFSGLALVGVVVAVYLQTRELEYQRHELELTTDELTGQREALDAQQKTLLRQGWDRSFFSTLEILRTERRRLVLDLPGMAPAQRLAVFDRIVRLCNDSVGRSPHGFEALGPTYAHHYRQHFSRNVSSYLALLWSICQVIADDSNEDGGRHADICFAQMSPHEKVFVAYHALSDMGSHTYLFKDFLIHRAGAFDLDFSLVAPTAAEGVRRTLGV